MICFAGAVSSRAKEPADTSTSQLGDVPLQQVAPGIFQLGSVRLNKERKTIQFPATINMTNGLIEYLVVTGIGKLHESILKTDTEPSQIHIAMLFIGAQGAGTNSIRTNISGDKFTIELNWKNGGSEKHAYAEDFIFNSKTKSPMSKVAWIYNGSKLIDGTFIAQRDGSIVAIISDPLALANNAQPDRDNDEIWFVKTNAVPPLNTAVEVTFQLEWPPKNAKNEK
ncbi:MAG: YdjY domain-containing protein [Verrucomicrobiota bacterium]